MKIKKKNNIKVRNRNAIKNDKAGKSNASNIKQNRKIGKIILGKDKMKKY